MPCLHDLSAIEARLEPVPWPFAAERAEEIAAHWEKLRGANPHLWNGKILLQHRWSLSGCVYRAGYTPADYAAFLAWRDFGWPGPPMRNGFAMAALQAADGAFLLGRMGAHTANPGRVYFPAGTPDLDDVTPEGQVDLAGSVMRELAEETGLRADEVTFAEGWRAVIDGPRVAFMKAARLALPAAEARALMLERMSGLPEQELDDIVIVRRAADIDVQTMPGFAAAYLAAAFGP